MSATYSVYGLSLRSNRSIPGLGPFAAARVPDLEVRLGLDPPWLPEATGKPLEIFYVNPERDEFGEPSLSVWKIHNGEYFLLRYADKTQFVIDRRATEIWATWPSSLTLEDTATYLLGPVLGFALLLRGIICLHASALAVDGQAIALVGPAGAGKSTTAAAFAKLGYRILSDDVLTLSECQNTFLAQPAYPCIRLWPSSVEALYGKADALPLLTPNWDKRYLDLSGNGHNFQREPLPLAAIYLLGPRKDDPNSPIIQQLSGKEKLIELIANTYTNYLMDSTRRAQGFEVLSRLVQNIPVRRIVPHSNPAYLPRLCEAILKDFQSVNVSSLTA
jgi:hypothetical protein